VALELFKPCDNNVYIELRVCTVRIHPIFSNGIHCFVQPSRSIYRQALAAEVRDVFLYSCRTTHQTSYGLHRKLHNYLDCSTFQTLQQVFDPHPCKVALDILFRNVQRREFKFRITQGNKNLVKRTQ
jgi:hypothetical protein